MSAFDEDALWSLMLSVVAARRRARQSLAADAQVSVPVVTAIDSLKAWQAEQADDASAQAFIDLYSPLLMDANDDVLIIGHLGQSLEACIACANGDSVAMTGLANHRHLHRMRALCDAIVIGGNTAALDDPRLNTRLVSGDSPVRVVIDPELRLSAGLALMAEPLAKTLIVCRESALHADPADLKGTLNDTPHCTVLGVQEIDGRVCLADVFRALQRQGYRQIFVEGGGVTVSRCLQAGVLDRLHVATSATIVGSGIGGLRLPPVASMSDALRPDFRLFRMGEDVLWDLDLRRPRRGSGHDGQRAESADIARLL